MNLGDVLNLTTLKLGEQHVFYPPEEVLRSGVNPAERLLCLVNPLLVQGRQAVVLNQDQPFVELRSLPGGNQIKRIRRVVLGDVTQEPATRTAATGEGEALKPLLLQSLVHTFNDWMTRHGTVKHYWMWGKLWLGVYRRPVAATTITLIYDQTPTPMELHRPETIPSIAEVHHTLLADVAANLLLMKEGIPDGQRGLESALNAVKGMV